MDSLSFYIACFKALGSASISGEDLEPLARSLGEIIDADGRLNLERIRIAGRILNRLNSGSLKLSNHDPLKTPGSALQTLEAAARARVFSPYFAVNPLPATQETVESAQVPFALVINGLGVTLHDNLLQQRGSTSIPYGDICVAQAERSLILYACQTQPLFIGDIPIGVSRPEIHYYGSAKIINEAKKLVLENQKAFCRGLEPRLPAYAGGADERYYPACDSEVTVSLR